MRNGGLCDGPVGMGHALLQIPPGVPLEEHPAQLDGRLWIAADARIDAREELIGKLKGKCRTAGALCLSTPDAKLILHAYDVWGEACVEHLLGDFSFALWDAGIVSGCFVRAIKWASSSCITRNPARAWSSATR